MKKLSLVAMMEIAIFAAFAFVLDLLPSIKLSPSISISFAMVPIFIIAFRWGVKASFISGLLWGLLQVVLGDAWIATPVQAFIEYFVAFACVGFAGLFAPIIQKHFQHQQKAKGIAWVVVATFVGSFARYFWHFIAGFIFFKEYAPEGMSPVLFSLVANGTTMLGAFFFCSIVLGLLLSVSSKLIIQKNKNASYTA